MEAKCNLELNLDIVNVQNFVIEIAGYIRLVRYGVTGNVDLETQADGVLSQVVMATLMFKRVMEDIGKNAGEIVDLLIFGITLFCAGEDGEEAKSLLNRILSCSRFIDSMREIIDSLKIVVEPVLKYCKDPDMKDRFLRSSAFKNHLVRYYAK
jgi:hypothetical protein